MVRILKKFNRKSTRRSRSKAAAIALTTVMALSAAVVFTVPKAEAANGPCDEGDWAYAYIAVGNSETKDNIFSSQGSNAIDGVSYDKASNTLTLNQYKNADNYIATNMMGDDFKIRLIGENEISSIVAYGDAWGGSVTICGDGSLTVNPKKQEDYGVRLYAEGTASVLSVENTCNVTIYAGQAGKVLYTTGNLTNKVIKDNGTLQETPQYQISHPLDIARIYAKYYAYDPSTTNVVYTNGDSSYYTLTYSLNENDEITAYNLYQLTKKEALGDIYYAVKIGSYDTMPEGYTQTVLDTDISYYDAAWGSGGTSNLVINTATNEKYAMVYDYDSETGSSVYRICALRDFLGMDEQGRDEVWLVDYDNPVSVIPAASMGQDEQLPDGFKYDGEEQENVFNIEVSADKLTFTAKTDAGDNENPAPDENKNGLQQSADGNWYYYTNNNIDYNYNGLAANEYGWWKITNGTVDFNYTGMAANEYGWWYVSNGTIDFGYTGMAVNEYGWWYMTNGALDFNYTGMAVNEYGWWYITNGALDLNYTGMALNEYGWWYMTNGALDLNYTGMALNEYGWWYMTNGALDLNYTGMALNEYGWWYMTNGALDLNYTGMALNEYGWWYMTNGALDLNYTGLAVNEYGWWYMTNGTVDFTYNGLAENEYGVWNVVNGHVEV